MTTVLGIDFGTTNSVVAALDTNTGQVRTARFSVGDTVHDVFRTVLCFWGEPEPGRTALRHAAGPAAITAYLDDPLDSRLVMSTKTYLASRNFTTTNLLGQTWTLEQLIGLFLRALFAAFCQTSRHSARSGWGRAGRIESVSMLIGRSE